MGRAGGPQGTWIPRGQLCGFCPNSLMRVFRRARWPRGEWLISKIASAGTGKKRFKNKSGLQRREPGPWPEALSCRGPFPRDTPCPRRRDPRGRMHW